MECGVVQCLLYTFAEAVGIPDHVGETQVLQYVNLACEEILRGLGIGVGMEGLGLQSWVGRFRV
jgi:hypothetical protein